MTTTTIKTINNNNFKFTAEDFGLKDETSIMDVSYPNIKIKPSTKIFAGFSSDTTISNGLNTFNPFKLKANMLKHYLVNLLIRKGYLIEELSSIINYDLNTIPLTYTMFLNYRAAILDTISEFLGFEENTLRNSGWGFVYLRDRHIKTLKERGEAFLQVAKMLGFWLEVKNSSKELIALNTINNRAYSGYGHNSPRTGLFVHEYEAVRYGGFHSPYLLEKMIWRTINNYKRKFNKSLSFENALSALGVTKQPHKAAIVARVRELFNYKAKSYREARNILVAHNQFRQNNEAKYFSLHFGTMTNSPNNNIKVMQKVFDKNMDRKIIFYDIKNKKWVEKDIYSTVYCAHNSKIKELELILNNSNLIGAFWVKNTPKVKKINEYSKLIKGLVVYTTNPTIKPENRTIIYIEKLNLSIDKNDTFFSYKEALIRELLYYSKNIETIKNKFLVSFSTINIGYKDSIKAGNCHWGTLKFMEDLGYPPKEDFEAPLLEVLEKVTNRNLKEEKEELFIKTVVKKLIG